MEKLVKSLLVKYGDPTKNSKDLGVIEFNGRKLYTNKLIALKLNRFPKKYLPMVKTIESFCVRKKRGIDEWSTHSWGAAIDINSVDNGMNIPIKQLAKNPGFLSDEFVQMMINLGFDVIPNDRMHFQIRVDDLKGI